MSKAKKTTLSAADVVSKVRKAHGIVGRENEIKQLWTAVTSGRNALIEGPVGVGKTALAQAVAAVLGHEVLRVDGDSRFTEQKLTGWFDPSLVLKKGYSEKTFIPGPLVEAMRKGAILFINELNRMPEAVQNVLLPAIDEGLVHIPQLGEVRAKPGFLLLATQNPREFVATSHLSEALMDRMEWVQLNYQSFEDEREIARNVSDFDDEPFLSWAVALVRLTRSHPKIKRGASIRAAIAILQMLGGRAASSKSLSEEDFWQVVKLALPTRIELNTAEFEGGYEQQIEALLREIWDELKKKLPEDLSNHFSLKITVNNDPTGRTQRINKAAAAFIAPELVDVGAPEDISGFELKPSWDVAVRFQDLKRLGHIPDKEKLLLKRRAIEGILNRAQRVLGSVLRPERNVVVDYRTFLETGLRGEMDVLATLEESLEHGFTIESLRFDARVEKTTDIALVMDASLSMTGEKIALLAVSTAVVALCVPSSRLSLMGFDSKVRWIKRFGDELPIETVIERVLELPAGGFTNMELALRETDAALQQQDRSRANVILIGDGKYTEGGDPTELAARFKHLNVLKIGRDQAGRDLLTELTVKGNGRFFEARRISDLPKTMYAAMKALL